MPIQQRNKNLIATIILYLFTFTVSAQIKGKVVAVADGDTFTMLIDGNIQLKIRLHGIDCPEKKQAFGQKATQFTSDMVFSKNVVVTSKGTDRYGRLLGIVHESGKCLNEELLKSGLAWHYTQYDKHNLAWKALESQAKARQVGLWCEKDCMAPWDWRKQKRNSAGKKKAA